MKAPHVYKAINAISAILAREGIPKRHANVLEGYEYRSIDDVLNAVAPLLSKHRLCVLPRVLERATVEWGTGVDRLLGITVRAAFDLVSANDGSTHTIEMFGEALDGSDKGTAKALSSAYKAAMVQTFCIPVAGDDPEKDSPKLHAPGGEPEPVQGWAAWSDDVVTIIGSCETRQALDLMRSRSANQLVALKRSRADLYGMIGRAFASRLASLAEFANAPAKQTRSQEPAAPGDRMERVAPAQANASTSRRRGQPEDASNTISETA